MNCNNPKSASLVQKALSGAPTEPSVEERYVSAGGTFCPHCGSREIVGGSVEIDCATASQLIQCQACESSWVDQYILAGFSDLEVHESDRGDHAAAAPEGES